MHRPDGMGADRHRERQNMKEARQETRTPPFELAALDADGEELYRTEYFESRGAASVDASTLNALIEVGSDRFDDEVASFEVRETEK